MEDVKALLSASPLQASAISHPSLPRHQRVVQRQVNRNLTSQTETTEAKHSFSASVNETASLKSG